MSIRRLVEGSSRSRFDSAPGYTTWLSFLLPFWTSPWTLIFTPVLSSASNIVEFSNSSSKSKWWCVHPPKSKHPSGFRPPTGESESETSGFGFDSRCLDIDPFPVARSIFSRPV
ncbi:hypothetical protein K438DRAFT_1778498 [Mycena galopus ATCC 62051]|nr:hypothetical protein K438DRAFT_1778498 [Mycena galopus ATCC 62051]